MKKIFTVMVALVASVASAFADVWTPEYNDNMEATVPFSALKASDGITIEQESGGAIKVTSDGTNGTLAIELPDAGIDVSDGFVVTRSGDDIFESLSFSSKDYGSLGGLWGSKYSFNGKADASRIGKLRHVNKMEWVVGKSTAGTMTITSIVIKKLADEDFQLKADEVNLTTSMFRDWTHWDNRIDAGKIGCAYEIGSTVGQGTAIYGSSGVEGKNFADLTGYKELRIYATAGKSFRVLFNRTDDGGGSAPIKEQQIKTNDEGVATLDLTSYDYVHLNAIKVAWGIDNATIKAIALAYDDNPKWDESSYWNPISKAKRQPEIERSLKAGLNTICLPIAVPGWTFQYTFGSDNKDAVAYEFKGVEGSKLLFEKVKDIQAGVPYLLDLKADCKIGKVGQAVDIAVEEPKAVTVDGITFQGTFNVKSLSTDGTNLFLVSDGKLAKPSTGDKENQLKGMRGYFVLPAATSEARAYSVSFGGNGTTGIHTVAGEQAVKAQGVYNLAGVKVANSTANLAKGVYIVNGKKFIQK